MNLSVPPLPPILIGQSLPLWRKWFAFWCLPLDIKADIVDVYPNLVIEMPTSDLTKLNDGPRLKVFFDPGVFDTTVPEHVVYKPYSKVTLHDGFYPLQRLSKDFQLFATKAFLVSALSPMNRAVLSYKYRYVVRPENYVFSMDYDQTLENTVTIDELWTFYELT